MRRRGARILWNLGLAATCVALSLTLAELCLRRFGPWSRAYFVSMPGAEWTTRPTPEEIHGVTGVNHFRVNAAGIRGRPFGADTTEYRILAVGGSTTECAVLDDSEAWPSLLESMLTDRVDGPSVWVGNVGRSGVTAREHVLHLEYLLPQYPRIDVAIAMVGVNDMFSALRHGWAYERPAPLTDPEARPAAMRRAFVLTPVNDRRVTYAGMPVPWLRATELWQLARRARLRWNVIRAGDSQRGHLTRARVARQSAAPHVDSLPALGAPLAEYRRNLNAMIDAAKIRNVRLVLVTQATLWRDSMPDAESRSLWLGWIGADAANATSYFSSGALHRAMTEFNRTLLEVCRERSVDCIDLDKLLVSDRSTFYDDVHFTEEGSRRVAALLARHFAEWPPFLRPGQ